MEGMLATMLHAKERRRRGEEKRGGKGSTIRRKRSAGSHPFGTLRSPGGGKKNSPKFFARGKGRGREVMALSARSAGGERKGGGGTISSFDAVKKGPCVC